jgi:Calcineurin-like phosphoesterase
VCGAHLTDENKKFGSTRYAFLKRGRRGTRRTYSYPESRKLLIIVCDLLAIICKYPILRNLRKGASKSIISAGGLKAESMRGVLGTAVAVTFSLSFTRPFGSAVDYSASSIPACFVVSRLQGHIVDTVSGGNQRVIVVGDIHGAADGLLEVLHTTNITASADSCEWRKDKSSDADGTLLVQMGDVVDRGPNTMKAYLCLEHLQRTAPNGSRVVRLLGNHELWWLEGSFHNRNEISDTKEVTTAVVNKMKNSIQEGEIRGAFAHRVKGLPLLFVHAGLRPAMTSLILRNIESRGVTSNSDSSSMHQRLVDYINNKVLQVLSQCLDTSGTSESSPTGPKKCRFGDPLFAAGPERGDQRNIGGPFWTDYSVLEAVGKELLVENSNTTLTPFVQIVGHTIHRGKVKHSSLLGSVCVDAGMYIGGRAFLEITPDARFISYEKSLKDATQSGPSSNWMRRDISSAVCDV